MRYEFIKLTEAGKRLSQIRTETGLNGRQFALKIGVDPSYLAKMEKGQKGISDATLQAIAEQFDINPQWILFGTGSKKGGQNVPRELTDQKNDNQVKNVTMEEEQPKYGNAKPSSDALHLLAQSNLLLAESNKSLARSHEELVKMLKQSTGGAQPQTTVAFSAMISDFLGLIAEIGSGNLPWKSREEAALALNKFVPLPLENSSETDTHSSSGKQHK